MSKASHKRTIINGENAIVTMWERGNNTHIDVTICTINWSPVSFRRDDTLPTRADAVRDIKTRYNLYM